jgi:uridine kinase
VGADGRRRIHGGGGVTTTRAAEPGDGVNAPLLVGIAGGSGSGKTTLALTLTAALGPKRVARLAHDAYYRDRSAVPAAMRQGLDYDVPDALDQPLFLAHLTALRAGAAVEPPRYCFSTHRRLGVEPAVTPRPIILVEGILLLCDPNVRLALDLSIFLRAPERLRLQRRLARDTTERGRTPESVLTQFHATVRPAHAEWVEPSQEHADLVLSTAGPIEPLAEIAARVITDRLARRAGTRSGAA